MPINRAEHKKNFTMILNSVLSDERLSYGARGLMAYVLTHYDNWSFSGEDYFITDVDKKTKIRGYIKELIKLGYLKRYRLKNEKGVLGDSVYIFFEIPNLENLNLENQKQDKSKENTELNPNLENLNLEKPNLDFPNLENLKDNNTNNINNINNIYSHIFEFWISKNIKKHRSLTNEMKRSIDKALKEYSKDEILEAINNYGDMYNDSSYQWCDYQWGLNEFLVRRDKDGLRQLGLFLNEGSKYLNYLKFKEQKEESLKKDTEEYFSI